MTPEHAPLHKRRHVATHRLQTPCSSLPTTKLFVNGYDATTKALIRCSCGYDTVPLEWGSDDNTLDIMLRLENMLRVPLSRYRIGADGGLLDPKDRNPLEWYAPFQDSCYVDLLLVPVESVEDYVTMFATYNLHPVWKHLKPSDMTTSSNDALHQATLLYHLINPVPSGMWERYVVLRKAAEADFYGTLRTTRHLSKLHPLMTQIRDGVSYVLRDARLSNRETSALADGVIPLTLNVSRSKTVTDADIYTRIHSVTRPAAVDIAFLYRHRTHQNRVDFYCHVFFKIEEPITSAKHARRGANAHVWERMFEMGTYRDSEDYPPRRGWHPVVQRKWGLEPSQVIRIRRALFGEEGACPANGIEDVDTVRLLFAAVGIPYRVGRSDGDGDYQESVVAKAVRWGWEHDEWIGMNIRRTCGAPSTTAPGEKETPVEERDIDDMTACALEKWYISKHSSFDGWFRTSSPSQDDTHADQSLLAGSDGS